MNGVFKNYQSYLGAVFLIYLVSLNAWLRGQAKMVGFNV
jgi:hypothetical protein